MSYLLKNWIIIVGVIISIFCRKAISGPANKIENIVKLWEQKEKKLNPVTFEWLEQIIAPKAGISDLVLKEMQTRGTPVINEDRNYQESNLLKLSGSKWRLDWAGKIIQGRTGELVEQNETIVFYEGVMKIHVPTGASRFPSGIIDKANFASFPRADTFRGVFLSFRPLKTKLIVPANYQILEETTLIKTRPCLIMEEKPNNKVINTFYLAPELDYAIIRWTIKSHNVIYFKADFDYKFIQGNWVPDHWTMVQADGKGRLVQSVNGQSKHCLIGVDLDEKNFDYQFPPGTLVKDFTKNSALGKFTQFLVREGGKNRIVLPSDVGATYKELVNSESGQAKPSRGHSFFIWLSLIAFLVAICAIFYRKFKTGKIF